MYELRVHRDGELIESYEVETAAHLDELLSYWGERDGYSCDVHELKDADDLDASLDEELA